MNDDLGELTRCYSIRFERTSKHPVDRLWLAVTSADQVSTWMGVPVRIDLRRGGEYFVQFNEQGEDALDGVIVAVEPERLLRYTWGTSVVEWRLEPNGSGTRYVFTHHGVTPRANEWEAGIAAGWHGYLLQLEEMFEGQHVTYEVAHARWQALSARYRPLVEAVLA
jgi:uncharacterized protein YndB with AHSA1/START domain